MKRFLILSLIFVFALTAFYPVSNKDSFIETNLNFATQQLKYMVVEANKIPNHFPKTIDKSGKMIGFDLYDWTSGFFPGNLWMAAEYSNDKVLKENAIEWSTKLYPLQNFTEHHDLGFMTYCSLGNAYRITGNKMYRDILIQSAKSLSTRYNKTTKSIKSWNKFDSWNNNISYKFPVIIDNLMNLELLFFASKETGDTIFKHIAIQHALTAMKYQIRPDYSSYHVVCYDTTTGKVIVRETAQGYSDNSTWARGQAWGIYGFTMAYRETKDVRFLKTAMGMADWFLNSKTLPADKIPFWDFNIGEAGYTPGPRSKTLLVSTKLRDASAAAITASALFELANYAGNKSAYYKENAIAILHSLASDNYRNKLGENGNFLLKHSVGSIPHGAEIDAPLIYADYYFLEALLRYNKSLSK